MMVVLKLLLVVMILALWMGVDAQSDDNSTPDPSPLPTFSPSPRPSNQPTPVPTANPTFAPTLQPTREPTPAPTAGPTFAPTPQPTREPTPVPTADPTFAPTPQPTHRPTHEPTPVPTVDPTFAPTPQPTHRPTHEPTPVPTADPTFAPTPQPTHRPTYEPTPVPTADPTFAPTPQPTYTPTSPPTSWPTVQPTADPSSSPTTVPSTEPTALPTSRPTSMPTSGPTKFSSARNIYCGSTQSLCKSGASKCNIFAYDTILHCDGSNPCVIEGSTVTLGPISASYETTLQTSGSCEVTFLASGGPLVIKSGVNITADRAGNLTFVSEGPGAQINMYSGSRVEGATISMSVPSGGAMTLGGVVSATGTSTLAPLNPSPEEEPYGWGGSYGGSGGRRCYSQNVDTTSAFSNVLLPQGSADVFQSWLDGGRTRGSRGLPSVYGATDGGLGGGFVLLAADTIVVDGVVSCAGEHASGRGGAGSGGAIAIVTASLGGTGVIKAVGGDADGLASAAGGGGRISIRVPYAQNFSQAGAVYDETGRLNYVLQSGSSLTISARGGHPPSSTTSADQTYMCVCGGGGGSVYLAVMKPGLDSLETIVAASSDDSVAGHLLSNNDNGCSRAASMSDVDTMQGLPSVSSLSVVGSSVMVINPGSSLVLNGGISTNISRPRTGGALSVDCTLDDVISYRCAYVYIASADNDDVSGNEGSVWPSVLSLGMAEHTCGSSCFPGTVDAELFALSSGGNFLGPTGDFELFNMTIKQVQADAGSGFFYSHSLTVNLAYGAFLGGAVIQQYSKYVFKPGGGLEIVGLGLTGASAAQIAEESTIITLSGGITFYSGLVLFASKVQMLAGSALGVPPYWYSCWPPKPNFICPSTSVNDTVVDGWGLATVTNFYPPTQSVYEILFNGTVYIAATQSIAFETGSILHTPAVLLCSDQDITITEGAAVRADSLGCPANEGIAAGGIGVDSTSQYHYGSSGAGNGGAGGAVLLNLPSPTGFVEGGGPGIENYPGPGEDYAVGSGSGGGCVGGDMCYNQTYDHTGKYHNGANSTLMRYNGGGGIVIVYGASSVKIDGEVSARGGDGNVMTVIEGRTPLSGVQRTYLGSGGGAGGTIVCATTKSVLGKGNFTAAGGRGGGRLSPGADAAYTPTNYSGGGGAGGQIWIYSFDESAREATSALADLFNYTGLVDVTGGASGDGDDPDYGSLPGGWGVVLWPQCRPGYGNSFYEVRGGLYNLNSICVQCAYGKYSGGGAMSGPIGPNAFQTNCSDCNQIAPSDDAKYASDRSILNESPDCRCVCDKPNSYKVYRDDKGDIATNCYAGVSMCISAELFAINVAFGGLTNFIVLLVLVFAFLVSAYFRKSIISLFRKKKSDVAVRKFGTNVNAEREKEREKGGFGNRGDNKQLYAADDDTIVTTDNPLALKRRSYMYDDPDGPVDDGDDDDDDDDDGMRATFNPIAQYARKEGRRSSYKQRSTEMVTLSSPVKDLYGVDNDSDDMTGTHTETVESYGLRARNVLFQEESEDSVVQRARVLQLKVKLLENELPHHCHRLYLFGSNHPFHYRGGAWKLSYERPTSLRPMLHAQRYYEMVQGIHECTGWALFGWDVLFFLFLSVFFPPFAPEVLSRMRRARAMRLFNYINNYDHACFRHPMQRKERRSLRLGISRCSTLAYIDFLYEYHETDEEDTNDLLCRPLAPIGQNKLPAVFKCCGFGTFFSPYYIDTNDTLIQTISQTDVPSKFIQRAWIDFVVELNHRLKLIQASGLRIGLKEVIQFLDNVNDSNELGGLVVELVTLSNVVPRETEANRLRRQRNDDFEMTDLKDSKHDEEEGHLSRHGAGEERGSEYGEANEESRRSRHSRFTQLDSTPRLSVDSQRDSEISETLSDKSNSVDRAVASGPSVTSSTPPITKGNSVLQPIGEDEGEGDFEESVRHSAPPLVFSSSMTQSTTPSTRLSRGTETSYHTARDRPSLRDSRRSRTRTLQSLVHFNHWRDSSDSPEGSFSGGLGMTRYLFGFGSSGNNGAKGDATTNGVDRTPHAHGAEADDSNKTVLETISSFFQDVSPRHAGDDHGLLMNFEETCASIAVGQLSIGIRVTAPKVQEKLRILTDDDYLSDYEESALLDMTRARVQSEMAHTRRASTNSRGSADGRGEEEGAEGDDEDSGAARDPLSREKDSDGLPGQGHTSGLDRLTEESIDHHLRRAYGTRGEERKKEMSKFYRIMLDAEHQTQKQLASEPDSEYGGSTTDDKKGSTGQLPALQSTESDSTASAERSRGQMGASDSTLTFSTDDYSSAYDRRSPQDSGSGSDRNRSGLMHEFGYDYDSDADVEPSAMDLLGAASPHSMAIESLFGSKDRDDEEDEGAAVGGGASNNGDGARLSSTRAALSDPGTDNDRGDNDRHSLGNSRLDKDRNRGSFHAKRHLRVDKPAGAPGNSMSTNYGPATHGKLTRRNRGAMPEEPLAQSNHQVLANAWGLQTFIVKRENLFGLPVGEVLPTLGSSSATAASTVGGGGGGDGDGDSDGGGASAGPMGSAASDPIPSSSPPSARRQVQVVSQFMRTHSRYYFVGYSSEHHYQVAPDPAPSDGEDFSTDTASSALSVTGAGAGPVEFFDSVFDEVDHLRLAHRWMISLVCEKAVSIYTRTAPERPDPDGELPQALSAGAPSSSTLASQGEGGSPEFTLSRLPASPSAPGTGTGTGIALIGDGALDSGPSTRGSAGGATFGQSNPESSRMSLMNRDTFSDFSIAATPVQGGKESPPGGLTSNSDANGGALVSAKISGGGGHSGDHQPLPPAIRLDGDSDGGVVTFAGFHDDDDDRGSVLSEGSEEDGGEEERQEPHQRSRVLNTLTSLFSLKSGNRGRAGSTDSTDSSKRRDDNGGGSGKLQTRLTVGRGTGSESSRPSGATDRDSSVITNHHSGHPSTDMGSESEEYMGDRAVARRLAGGREAANFKNNVTAPLLVRAWGWVVHVALRLRMAARMYRHSDFTYYSVRLVNGANITPILTGRSTARRVMQIVLLIGCYIDLVLWSATLVFGQPALCPRVTGEGFQCEDGAATPYLIILNMVWPGAAFFSIIGGIFVHSSELKVNQIRIYSAYSRLFVVPILLFIFFYFYFSSGGLGFDQTYEDDTSNFQLLIDLAAAMLISRFTQIVITEQYIALVDRIRLTLGWDGLTTAIFQTKDSKRDMQSETNKFQEF